MVWIHPRPLTLFGKVVEPHPVNLTRAVEGAVNPYQPAPFQSVAGLDGDGDGRRMFDGLKCDSHGRGEFLVRFHTPSIASDALPSDENNMR